MGAPWIIKKVAAPPAVVKEDSRAPAKRVNPSKKKEPAKKTSDK